MATRILINEDYGWRYWVWDYPGTLDELRADWAAGLIPKGLGYVGTVPGFRGSIEQVEPLQEYMERRLEETSGMTGDESIAYFEARQQQINDEMVEEWHKYLAGFGAEIDIHEEEDSFLRIDGKVLPWMVRRDEDERTMERVRCPLPKERP